MLTRPLTRPLVRPLTRRVTEPAFGGWSPRVLFASGEVGAWYDPSDTATLFQDSAGTTPVTALGQPVGLMLDKSKGLVRGPELVTNGGFDSDLSGWSVSTGAGDLIEWVGGTVHITTTGSVATFLNQNILTAGKFYEIEFDVLAGSSGKLKLYQVGTSGEYNVDMTPGHKRFVLPQSSGSVFGFYRVNGVAADAYIDNISVRELPGNHASQSTDTARPTLQQDANGKYYLDFDGVDDFLSASLVLSAYPLTLAAAAKADANAEGGVVSLYQSSTQYKCIVKSPADTQWGVYDRNASALFSGEVVGTNATPHVLIGRFSTDSVNLIMDGVDTVAAAANTNAFGTSSALYLGRIRATGLYLNGRVYGAGMVAKDISAAEQDVLQRFLALRSGATLA